MTGSPLSAPPAASPVASSAVAPVTSADPQTPPAKAPGAETPSRLKAADVAFHNAMEAHQKGQIDEAITGYNNCLLLNPRHARAVNNLAVALRKKGRYSVADALYRRAHRLEPDNAAALINHGNVLRDLGRYEEAETHYLRASELEPTNRGSWYGLGLIYRDMKRIPESIAALEKTLSMTPGDPEVTWDLSHSLLCGGDFKRGMALYESRWSLRGVHRPNYPWPEWDGKTSLEGKTILLYGEQGFGDILQFARFIPHVVALGAKVALHLRPELMTLFMGQFHGVVHLYGRDDPLPPTACDLVAPLMSVPFLLGLGRDDIPRKPYLRPPIAQVRLPDAALEAKLRVGLCWQGSPTHKNDRNRSMPFAALTPLVGLPELALFSLQKGPAANAPQDYGIAGSIQILDPFLKSFAESAVVLNRLDLLITVDTSLLHLAAAMGKPVWMLLPISHDWRVDADDSLATWYPTVRVFKQTKHGDWASVMEQVFNALDDLLASLPQPQAV